MTDEEINAAAAVAIDNSLKLVKALFPTLLGHGLLELSGDQDQRIFTEACDTMESRLIEKNRDGNYYIDEGDRVTGDYTLKEYRRRLTK